MRASRMHLMRRMAGRLSGRARCERRGGLASGACEGLAGGMWAACGLRLGGLRVPGLVGWTNLVTKMGVAWWAWLGGLAGLAWWA